MSGDGLGIISHHRHLGFTTRVYSHVFLSLQSLQAIPYASTGRFGRGMVSLRRGSENGALAAQHIEKSHVNGFEGLNNLLCDNLVMIV